MTLRRRGPSRGILTGLLGLWALRLGGVIGNWTMVWATLALVAGLSLPTSWTIAVAKPAGLRSQFSMGRRRPYADLNGT